MRRRAVAFWVCKGVLKEQKVFKHGISGAHTGYRSNALLSNAEIDIVYSTVEKLELKGLPAD